MRFGSYLVQRGLASPKQIVAALDRQSQTRIPLGKLAVEMGRLTERDVFQILNLQTGSRMPFGQIAMEFGYFDDDTLTVLLDEQSRRLTKIGEILVEMNVITRGQLEQELKGFRGLTSGTPVKPVGYRALMSVDVSSPEPALN